MNGKRAWTGVAPSPKIFAELDPEETAVLALLAWCFATRRSVTSRDLAALPDRNGRPLGLTASRSITEALADMGIASVLGMNNDRPLSIFLGGYQPASRRFEAPRPAVREQAPAPRKESRPVAPPPSKKNGKRVIPRSQSKAPSKPGSGWGIDHDRRVEATLAATPRTPEYVLKEARKLRERQLRVESAESGLGLVEAAEERLRILEDRISLYERWLGDEPTHPTLAASLKRKRKAVPELRFQLERARLGPNRRARKE